MNTHLRIKSLVSVATLCTFALILPMLFHPAQAWAADSVLTGVVTDPSAAAIPDATVKVHNTKTDVDSTTVSNAAGIYRISEPPGVYNVTFEKTGFKVAQFTAITLTVDQVLTLNASMEVGAVTQTVEVTGKSVAPIDLQDGQLSTVIEQSTIVDMPLITRDPYSLTLLTPGVIASTTRFGGFSSNGAREKDNNFLLDGVDNNDTDVPGGGDGLNALNPDSAQEFRVISTNFSAEYGRSNGALIDVVTKSGTNTIHGEGHWFGRYDALGARDYFNLAPDTPKNPYIRNTFGGSAGGAIIKDKTFWFANYEGYRWITATTDVSAVPTAAFKTGVFQAIDPASGNPVTVDVSSPTALNNGAGYGPDPTVQGKIFPIYPAPNGPMIDNATGLYFFPSEDRLTADSFTIKIDHHINDRNTLSGRYAFVRYYDPSEGDTNFLPPNLGGVYTAQRTQNLGLDWAATLRANLVNDLRVGANRTTDPFKCNGTSLFDGLGPDDPFGRGSDYDFTDGYGGGPSDFGCGELGDLDSENRHTGTYQIIDGLTWVRGKHSLKFGWEGRDIYSNSYADFGSRTTFGFSPEYSYGVGVLTGLDAYPGIENDPILNDEVAGLLGVVSSQSQTQFFNAAGARTADDLRGFRQKEMGVYAQDSWKIRPNLTIDYGLRWEYFGVPFEAHNNFSNLFADPSGPGPFTFSIVGPGNRSAWQNEYANFEPRLGFAWDPFKTGKTSVRGAYGVFHTRVYGNLFEDARGNPPFEEPYSLPQSEVFSPLTGLPAPSTVPTSATVTNYDPVTGEGGFVFPDLFDPNFHSPYSENWNFGIQRQITDSLQIEVNYVGVRGLRLFREVDGNPPQPGLVAALEAYCKNPGNAYGCVDSADESTLTSYNLWIGAEEGTLPFDAVNNNAFEENCCTPGADLNKSIAKSFYDALQVTLDKRLSRGMTFHVAYTWGHALDNASDPLDPAGDGTSSSSNRSLPRNSFRLQDEYGNSDFDVRQRVAINFEYEPNIGRGKGYLNEGMVGRILEGWKISGLPTFQTGQPYDIFGDRDSQHTGLSDRPDVVGPTAIPAGSPKTQTGPPVTAFANPPYDSSSNLSRNKFFGPGINNWDGALLKDTSLNERVKLQFRLEVYNIFNRVQLGIPQNSIANTLTFGTSDYQVGNPDGTTGARQVQFGLKLLF